jgi:predicted GNAT family acetyltransferase
LQYLCGLKLYQLQHILNNPIWHALTTGNKKFAAGTKNVKYFKRDVALFAGMKRNSKKALQQLHGLLPEESKIILFTPAKITVPQNWSVLVERPLLQMVYSKKQPQKLLKKDITRLTDKNIAAMLKLTQLTNPGPFFKRTIDFGNYEGIFYRRRLVAVTGQRLHAGKYIEVSAVCTHPEHTGKGYAARLIQSQLHKIIRKGKIPFLHVYPENPACHLYEKLGFKTRKQMIVYLIEKNK